MSDPSDRSADGSPLDTGGMWGSMARRTIQTVRNHLERNESRPRNALPVPLVFGRARIPGRPIYIGAPTVNGQHATIDIQFLLCEGEIVGVRYVAAGKGFAQAARSETIRLASTVATGTRPTQTAWVNLPSGKDLGYPGVAILSIPADYRYAGDLLTKSVFDIDGLRNGSGDSSTGDADPTLVISDILTNANFGAGFPYSVTTNAGQDDTAASSAERYVKAAGMWVSPTITEQRAAIDILGDILTATNCEALWSDGQLKIIPLGDESLTGNGVTFTPVTAPQYALGPDDFIVEGDDDLIEVERIPDDDVYNTWPVEYLERSPAGVADDPNLAYEPNVVEDPDPVDVLARGVKRAAVTQIHMVCRRDVAQRISAILAQRAVYCRTKYKFRLGWRFCRLEPLDLVTLTEPILGLDNRVVRITSIRENEDHVLELEAEEWPFGVATAVVHDTASNEGSPTASVIRSIENARAEAAASNWTKLSLPAGTPTAVTAGGGLVAMIGTTGYGAWSVNGVDWAASSSVPAMTTVDVAWSDSASIFAAIGNGVAMSSSDADTWTTRTSTFVAGNYKALAATSYGFACVGLSGAAGKSSDGINWSLATTGPSGDYYAIAADSDVVIAAGNGVISTSADGGDHWTARTDPHTGKVYAGIVAGLNPGEWIAVTSTGESAITSDDGDTWSVGPTIGTAPRAITRNDWIMVATQSANLPIYISHDGEVWMERDAVYHFTLPTAGWSSMTVLPSGRFVAVSSLGGMVSADPGR